MAMSAGFPTGEELPERIGHYVIRRRIGQGGMGVVYQAEDPRTEQFVAVKVLKPEVAGDHIARARLAREVETMRRVHSPNVAEVIDADTQAELPWVVTEYIPGPTLDSTVTDHGPLRGRALRRFVTGLARAIKDIHEVEVIHRDLKPGNVIISNGEPIVIDFGIAHAVDGAKLTQTGTFVGTPSYLSPEVIEGTDLGPATDIHAWGGTVAFASTGRPPYGAGSFEVIFFRILNGEIDMDGMHEALRPLVNRAVSRDMARRPAAAQLVEETSRLNLDLPWTEDAGGRPTGLTGNHTVYNPSVGGLPESDPAARGGPGGAAAAGAAGAGLGGAAGYLAGRASGGDEGWGPPHTSSGAHQAAGSWSLPKEPPHQTSVAHASGWDSDPEATDDLSGAADDARRGRDADGDPTDDLGGTERITPSGSDDLDDPQGTMRINPVGAGDDLDDMQGTRRFQPGELSRDEPQGTMMMESVDGNGHRPVAEDEGYRTPQTQFFNTPLHKGDFADILTPVDDDRHSGRTQEFDEEDYEERGGWLNRFRRGSNDRMGDYFRGGDDGYYDDEGYEAEAWRMHPLVLIPVMFSLAGVALWFPWFGILLGIVIIAGLSALDVVKAEHARRLQTRGPRSSDSMVVALSFPWAFGRMVLRTVGFGLIYLLAGILVGMVYAQILETGDHGANYTGSFAVFVMILLSYIMPSGRGARHQAVWLVERVRFHNLYLYIGVVIGILLLTMLIMSIGLSSFPLWAPWSGPSDWFA
ncbi:bifunctional serine/threonine protein kinase/MFS transporter [Nocardiopsis quinghaiensis]|uniref:bifunctional serine/threonine protein kinase/MFS transporter n=1 Tax=Nocardiopsis quinghaiensis TaxID=464995 RepID=UPI001CC25D43|nr:bifunctional serine/threonine protein kinase/MFS transporter [Nocardiopsis quinghaiensis]